MKRRKKGTGSIRERGGRYYYSLEAAQTGGSRNRPEHYGGDTYEEAERALNKAQEEFARGGVHVDLNNISVHDYFEYWYEHYVLRQLKKNTWLNYRNVLDKYVSKIGKYKMQSISTPAIQKIFDDLADEEDLKKHSVDIVASVIKSGFKRAVFPYQVIKENPAEYIIMPRFANERQSGTREDLKIITIEQYSKLLENCPVAHPFHIPLVLAFNTGLRRGEVCGLTWDNVDLDQHMIHVAQIMNQYSKTDIELGTPKTQASIRDILIGQTLIDELKAAHKRQLENRMRYGKLYHDNNFVCTCENGKPVTPNSIKYFSAKFQKDLGFPFKFHSLRHTHATMLLENGAKPKEVQARLGHSRIETTMDTYVHVTKKMEQHTVDIMERIQGNR